MTQQLEKLDLERLDRVLAQLAATLEVVYSRRILEEVLGDLDEVTAAQLRTLKLLSSEPQIGHGLLIGAISEGLRISYPAASKAVDRLVERGLAERRRSEGDARQTFVCLTERGRAVVEKVKLERQAKLERTLQKVGNGREIDGLTELLERFIERSVHDPNDAAEIKLETGF
jgi:DNA-binding MarR family transcriptional regulator